MPEYLVQVRGDALVYANDVKVTAATPEEAKARAIEQVAGKGKTEGGQVNPCDTDMEISDEDPICNLRAFIEGETLSANRVPEVNLQDVTWEICAGTEEAPDYILASVMILGRYFHFEGVAVERVDDPESGRECPWHQARDVDYQSKVDAWQENDKGGLFYTVELFDRQFVLFISPGIE